MIRFKKKILLVLILIISSCSSLDSLKQSYKNLLPSAEESYIVQPGDSIWSIARNFNLPSLSMGMSNDYLNAVQHGSTMIRVGSKIFGERN